VKLLLEDADSTSNPWCRGSSIAGGRVNSMVVPSAVTTEYWYSSSGSQL
jgi:hypothetical protein